MGLPWWLSSKESACNVGNTRIILGEGNGNLLQYSCLENPMDRRAWWARVHGVTRVGHDLATKSPLNIYICIYIYSFFSSVQFSCSVMSESATPWTAAHQASLCITNSRSSLKLVSIESVMPSNYLIFCHPLLLSPSIFPSIRVFSDESVLCIRWPKYWSFSFSFSMSPSNEYSGLISFRMDWLDLLAVQGTLKNLLQHHSSKASIPRR